MGSEMYRLVLFLSLADVFLYQSCLAFSSNQKILLPKTCLLKMTQSRYSEDIIIKDALENGLIKSIDDIPHFRFAHFRGMRALTEYYINVPKSMMSVVYRPPKETGTRMIQKLMNYQYDGMSLDEIIASESKILRDQVQFFNVVMKFNSRNTILTNDGKYSLPIHSSEKVSVDDSDYIKVRDVIIEELTQNPDLLRTRKDVDAFIERNQHLPKLGPDEKDREDKLITYLILRKII